MSKRQGKATQGNGKRLASKARVATSKARVANGAVSAGTGAGGAVSGGTGGGQAADSCAAPGATPKSAAKPRRRRKEARPGEIVQAAVAEFSEAGFAAAKIERIAARAGVAKGTVFVYFPSKDDLFAAVVRENIGPVFGGLDHVLSAWTGSMSDLLANFISHLYNDLIDRPERRVVMKILVSEGSRFPRLAEFYHREVMTGARKMIRKIIRRGVRSGEFRNGPAAAHPEVLVGPAIMAAVWKMTFEPFEPLRLTAYRRAHIDLVLNGLRARPADVRSVHE